MLLVAMIVMVVTVVMAPMVAIVLMFAMVVKEAVRMNFWMRVVPTNERFDFEALRGFLNLFFETFYEQKLFQELLPSV